MSVYLATVVLTGPSHQQRCPALAVQRQNTENLAVAFQRLDHLGDELRELRGLLDGSPLQASDPGGNAGRSVPRDDLDRDALLGHDAAPQGRVVADTLGSNGTPVGGSGSGGTASPCRPVQDPLDTLFGCGYTSVSVYSHGEDRGDYAWTATAQAEACRSGRRRTELDDRRGYIDVVDGRLLLTHFGSTRSEALDGLVSLIDVAWEWIAKVEYKVGSEQVGEPASAHDPGQTGDEVDLAADAGPKGDGGQASHATAPPVGTPSAARRFVEWWRSMGFS